MRPYFDEGGITIYHGDCREILPELQRLACTVIGHYPHPEPPNALTADPRLHTANGGHCDALADLVLTDPPYGIDLDTDNSRFSGGTAGNMAKRGNGVGPANGAPVANDAAPFDPSFLVGLGRHQIIWGWNNYPDKLPRGACLVWLKRYDEAFGTFLSDAETAWMSKGHGVYCRRDLSNNGIANERVHPTQKPESLMRWCLEFFPKAASILDPFMGSGTTLRAAKDLGRKAIGIEIEERYCEIAAKRMAQGVLV